jgi:hypothetical protein
MDLRGDAAESNGDPRAVSPKGAMGLMQIMPRPGRVCVIAIASAPILTIRATTSSRARPICASCMTATARPWIAAYNAGPGRYEASLKGRPLPAETRAYVANVAPSLSDGDAPAPILIAAADPLAWTRAPLFVAPSARTTAADPSSVERTSDGANTTPGVRDVSAIVPQSGGLFVARADTGRQP